MLVNLDILNTSCVDVQLAWNSSLVRGGVLEYTKEDATGLRADSRKCSVLSRMGVVPVKADSVVCGYLVKKSPHQNFRRN